jgi:hypothetical protein
MIDLNVCDLLVAKALSSLNMWNYMIGPPWFMINKFSGASLKQCILLPQFGNCLLFLGLCHCIWIFSGESWFYSYALPKCLWLFCFFPMVTRHMLFPNVYDYFIFASTVTKKYSYVFPLKTDVVLRVYHK